MPTLPAASFDAIITDPPYGTTACAWDTVIPFGPMWVELKRLIKPKGAIVLFGSQPFTSALVMSNPGWFRYEWVWDKKLPSGHLNAKHIPMKRHENILIFSPETLGNFTYNPKMRRGLFRQKGSSGKLSEVYGKYDHYTVWNDQYYPVSLIEFANANQAAKDHPNQKPLALIEYLVDTYTGPDGTVLDFTMGSGTTLRAAKNLGRRAVGIELEEKYVEIAIKRLAQEAMELV
jgi:site-specific DNA-methyltransferase (adenine-specific)